MNEQDNMQRMDYHAQRQERQQDADAERTNLNRRMVERLVMTSLKLDDKDFTVLSATLLFPGITRREQGELVGMTRQGASQRVMQMCNKYPALKKLMRYKGA